MLSGGKSCTIYILKVAMLPNLRSVHEGIKFTVSSLRNIAYKRSHQAYKKTIIVLILHTNPTDINVFLNT